MSFSCCCHCLSYTLPSWPLLVLHFAKLTLTCASLCQAGTRLSYSLPSWHSFVLHFAKLTFTCPTLCQADTHLSYTSPSWHSLVLPSLLGGLSCDTVLKCTDHMHCPAFPNIMFCAAIVEVPSLPLFGALRATLLFHPVSLFLFSVPHLALCGEKIWFVKFRMRIAFTVQLRISTIWWVVWARWQLVLLLVHKCVQIVKGIVVNEYSDNLFYC